MTTLLSSDSAHARRTRRTVRPRLVALVGITVATVIFGMLTSAQTASADTMPTDGTPVTASSDALPAPQINGVVWDQVAVGNTVYVAGSFTTARPAGSAAGVNTVARNNFLAYNLTTGALLPWAPSFNQQVRSLAASPDGTRLYAGGQFTTVNGANRYRLAAFDLATQTLVAGFAPSINSIVKSVAATNTTVYAGGQFTSAQGAARAGIAGFSASNAALTPLAPAVAGGTVQALTLNPDGSRIVIGGNFTSVNGSDNPGYGLAAFNTADGSALPWAINSLIRNGGEDASINSLTSDGTSVYGTGYTFGGGGNIEGAFKADWDGGTLQWVEDCHGDSYAVAAATDVVYVASHAHYCGNVGGYPQTDPWGFQRATAFTKATTGTLTADPHGYYNFNGTPAPTLLNWFPTINTGTFTGASQGPWDVAVAGDYVLYGGEFTVVNGVAMQGLVRFANPSIAPNKDGPRLNGANFVPTVTSFSRGTARISWQANYDRDNSDLTYQVIRNNVTGSPVYTTSAKSTFWKRPVMSFLDTGLTPGQTYNYRIRATDPYGNFQQGLNVAVTISEDGAISSYQQSVLNDNPTSLWPLGESSGTTAYDWNSGDDLLLTDTGVTRGATGQEASSTNKATTFSGGSSSSTVQKPSPNTFTTEAWFKTTTTSGGKIIGFGGSATGNSSSYDRHVYMGNDGRLNFGTYTGNTNIVTSPNAYNDGQWHQVAASLGANGMQLFVDGKKVASRADITSGQVFNGYWRVGGDNIGGWPNGPSSSTFSGDIDDVSVFPTVLTRQQIDAHYVASGRTSTVPTAPADAYGAAVFGLDPALYWRLNETSGSTAVDAGPTEANGLYFGQVTKGANGAISGVDNTAAQFTSNGWDEGGVSSQSSYSNPTSYAMEAWFQTTSTQGGKVIGFGSNQTGGSGGYDRHVFLRPDGKLVFGTWTGQENTITSQAAVNDGQWHHVVAQQSAAGMKLFIDGSSVGTNPQTGAQDYTGYWRVGGDNAWQGSVPYFNGKIDEVAVYNAPLTDAQVAQHRELGLGQAPNALPTAAFTNAVANLDLTTDATTSTDTDGVISSYAWDFGDGQTGTGATAAHHYAAGGTYTVTLTVTDNRGGTATMQQTVTAVAPNQLPTAAFTPTVVNLDGSFDASASADPDGTIASYAWNFGDGTSGTGVTATHSYATAGTFTVSLTVTDNVGATASATHDVVTTLPPNQLPVASFTAASTGLTASFDGSGASDPDGTIASVAWNFGDGATGTGTTTTHSYATAGTYTVTQTVTDNRGGTAATTLSVTVAPIPAASTYADDTFERTASSAWGNAATGGAWTVSGGNSSFSVANGTGKISLPASGTRTARLNAVSVTDVTVTTKITASAVADGGGVYASVIGRQVGSAFYSARVWLQANGAVRIQLLQGATALQAVTIPGLTYTAGQALQVKLQVTGTAPTTLGAKVWVAGATEPTAWQVTATDSTAGLQAAGLVGLGGYLSGSTTNGPITLTFDDFLAGATGAVQPTPVNQAPTAAFTATPSGLTAALDASGSTDPDGTIASVAWNYGDGQTGTGVTSSHVYAAGGTYTVTLTVTDNGGLTATTTQAVTVTAPVVPPVDPAPVAVAADTFARTTANGWGSAETGGAWTLSGAASSFSVTPGAGVIQVPAGQTRSARLAGVSAAGTDSSVSFTIAQAPTGGGQFVSLVGRRVGTDSYTARAWVQANGVIQVQLMRGTTVLRAVNLTGVAYTPGAKVNFRSQVSGSGTTTMQAKAWIDGQAEPNWQAATTDTTAALQAPGAVGIDTYVSGSVTNAPIVFTFSGYKVSAL
ncbi:PKD repeat-containing protein [Plantibacter flavus]|uniref:PKD repeat protein n=1 Tax=Plantibacter flavus TaxID=150123 RepID=A0A3N2BZT9_9MICO|nr:PKD domain-containing protein [Plantibacter flavus]ROR80757.1 PKD repeat protein [Plantibacter flavus]SMG31473.1 PKD repeat-containing protein [Plantibacter flavus]